MIFCLFLNNVNLSVQRQFLLTKIVSLSLVDLLGKWGVSAKIKWPNDIYAQSKKLAGVLIEVEGSLEAGCDCVIGIGLNIALPDKVKDICQPWIDLASLSKTTPDRNLLAAKLIEQLYTSLVAFEQQGLTPFVDSWRAIDEYKEQKIKLIMGQQTIEGVGKGIDNTGALLLQTEKGIQAYHGGEISVRPV